MKRDFTILALVIFIISFIVLLVDLPSLIFFHRDEINWIRVSRFSFNNFFIKRDFRNEGWGESFRNFGLQNPQVGKYIIGGSLALQEYRDFEGVVAVFEGLKRNFERGTVPTAEEFYMARLPIALLSSATVTLVGILIMLILCSLIKSKLLVFTGVFTGCLLFLTHPEVWKNSHRAMIDMPAIFFSTLAIVLIVNSFMLFNKKQFIKSLLLSAAAATSLGLSISTKMNAFLTWMAVVVAIVLMFVIVLLIYKTRRSDSIKYFSLYLVLQLVLPIAVFIGSNPFLYRNSFANIKKMLQFSDIVISRRSNNPDIALYTLSEKATTFGKIVFGGSIADLINNIVIEILFLTIGLLIVTITLVNNLRHKQANESNFIFLPLLIWFFVTCIGILIWSPVVYPRYYIPSIPSIAIFQGVGFVYILLFIGQVSESIKRWRVERA